MNKLFAIGIPTINRWDLLKPSLQKYFIDFPDTLIFIVDNGNQAIDLVHDNLMVLKNIPAKSVAASWNQLCKAIYGSGITNALILNDDIYLGRTQKQISVLLTAYPPHQFYISQRTWCSFILPCSTWNVIGRFDENFKGAYFEDNDYTRRLKLAKAAVMVHMVLNPVSFIESGSITKDPSLNSNFDANASYYMDKWGGLPGKETYLSPFNK